jgi:RNA polymerase sigma factor (sigma-70 family)
MDPDRLGRLVDRHAAALELYARQWCDTPEDVVQEAFVKLATLGASPENASAWLFRVVRNGAVNAGLATKRRRRREAAVAHESATWFETNALQHSDALDPETATSELQALPIEQREAIVAHLWGGLTFEQIAEVSGSSASTAYRNYAAGLSTIRQRLGVACRKSRPI